MPQNGSRDQESRFHFYPVFTFACLHRALYTYTIYRDVYDVHPRVSGTFALVMSLLGQPPVNSIQYSILLSN